MIMLLQNFTGFTLITTQRSKSLTAKSCVIHVNYFFCQFNWRKVLNCFTNIQQLKGLCEKICAQLSAATGVHIAVSLILTMGWFLYLNPSIMIFDAHMNTWTHALKNFHICYDQQQQQLLLDIWDIWCTPLFSYTVTLLPFSRAASFIIAKATTLTGVVATCGQQQTKGDMRQRKNVSPGRLSCLFANSNLE